MSSKKLSLILAGLIIAVSMTNIDSTIVSLSSQAVQSGLGFTAGGIQWVVNAYMLAAAAAFPICGHLSDALGYKKIMLTGTFLFALGSLACALVPATSSALTLMLAARALQGVGSAMMFPAAIGILFSYSAPAFRAKNMALFFAVTGAMTCLGPILGSWLVTHSWRDIFFINLPLAVAAIVMIALMIPADGQPGEDQRRIDWLSVDWLGGLLVGTAMVALIVSLQQGQSLGWSDWRIIGGLGASVLLFTLFIAWDVRQSHPVIKLGVFASKPFNISQFAMLVAAVIFQPIMYFLSVYGLLALNRSTLMTSLFILYFFFGYLVSALFGARLFSKSGMKPVLLLAGIVATAGFAWMSVTAGSLDKGLPTNTLWLSLAMVVAGAGIGFMFSPSSTDTVNRAIGASYGEVTAINQTFKNFGGALGMAVLGPLCTHYFAQDIHWGLSKYGVSVDQARSIANSVGSGASGGASSQLASLPAGVRKAVMEVVRASYATGSGKVFLAMACLSVVFVFLALVYPSKHGNLLVSEEVSGAIASEA
ncbi:MFS transporter [Bombiscardovia nodaiensis]|uniref:MFS transporter n=1 Tax=Bombiscardovia nodaiensis TaxID=2932181 RepID=A0ABN6SBU6_9BIFI|nr:MFS transporter [Bombiscardovia nodaiensis]